MRTCCVVLSPISLLSVAKGSAAEGVSGYWVLRREAFGHRLVHGINFRLLYANYTKAKLLQGKGDTSGRDVQNEVSIYCCDRFIRCKAKHELVLVTIASVGYDSLRSRP